MQYDEVHTHFRQLKSSLEAEVDLILPENVEGLGLVSVLRREGRTRIIHHWVCVVLMPL